MKSKRIKNIHPNFKPYGFAEALFEQAEGIRTKFFGV